MVNVVSIFPDYLAALDLSLIGKARRDGLLDVRVHDLRDFTHDRHRTVDDSPYGGGAGMVMRPEPWGEALDGVVASGHGVPHLVVPSPAGRAVHAGGWPRRPLAAESWLVSRLRPVRGHRRARPRGMPPPGVAGLGRLPRRLRPQRGRGRRPGHRRGRRPAAARRHRERGVPRRGVARRGRAARVPRLHQAPRLARPRRPARAPLRRPRRDRGLAAGAARRPHRRPSTRPAPRVGGARRRRPGRPARPAGRRRDRRPATRLLAVGGGRERDVRGHPGPRRGRRRGPPRVRRVAYLGRPQRRTARRLRAGARLGRRGRAVGDRPADGRPGPAGPRDRAGPSRVCGVRGAHRYQPVLDQHRNPEQSQPAAVPAGGIPRTPGGGPVPGDRRPGQGRPRSQSAIS